MRYAVRFWSFAVVSMLGTFAASIEAGGGEKKDDKGKVAGILIDRKDRTLTIRGDGGDDDPARSTFCRQLPTRQVGRDCSRDCSMSSRVQITYNTNGDQTTRNHLARPRARQGERAPSSRGRSSRCMTIFWVEVKPANGPPEGFASGIPNKSKEIVETLKILQKGDTVTIRYYTDFERHRIQV